MTFECKDLERSLEIPELLKDAREHARNCAACRRQLWLWNEMSAVAGGLREEWDSPELWPAIRTRLAAEPRKLPRRRSYGPWLGAIAAILLIGAGCLAWFNLRPQPPANGPIQGDLLTEQTLKEVEQAEAVYAKSIEKLSRVAVPQLAKSDTELTAAYREKLLLLDSAIADLKTNISQNRFNAHLQIETGRALQTETGNLTGDCSP